MSDSISLLSPRQETSSSRYSIHYTPQILNRFFTEIEAEWVEVTSTAVKGLTELATQRRYVEYPIICPEHLDLQLLPLLVQAVANTLLASNRDLDIWGSCAQDRSSALLLFLPWVQGPPNRGYRELSCELDRLATDSAPDTVQLSKAWLQEQLFSLKACILNALVGGMDQVVYTLPCAPFVHYDLGIQFLINQLTCLPLVRGIFTNSSEYPRLPCRIQISLHKMDQFFPALDSSIEMRMLPRDKKNCLENLLKNEIHKLLDRGVFAIGAVCEAMTAMLMQPLLVL